MLELVGFNPVLSKDENEKNISTLSEASFQSARFSETNVVQRGKGGPQEAKTQRAQALVC